MAPAWLTMFVSSTLPVVQIVLMCCMGALLAHKNILHSQARQHLGQLVFFMFVPALTFTRLAAAVDLRNLAIWWPLPVNAAISIVFGMLIGWATALVIRPPDGLKMHIIVATGLGNLGNMPLVIVAALCNDDTSQFAQVLGLQCNPLGIAYVIFAMWVASIAQYSVAYNMLKLPAKPFVLPTPTTQSLSSAAVAEPGHRKVSRQNHSASRRRDSEEALLDSAEELEMQPLWPHDEHADSADVASLVEAGEHQSGQPGNVSSASLQNRSSTRSDSWQQSSSPAAHSRQTAAGSSWQQQHHSLWQNMKRWTVQAWRLVCLVITMPAASALLGLAVGCTPAIKSLLFATDSETDPPLGFLTQSLDTMAGAMIPSMMLILGSVLHKGPGSAKMPVRVILGVLGVRQILIPLLGTAMVVLAHRWHVFTAPDPLFLLVLLLGHTTPTAINMQTVVTIHQNREAEMSCLLFWQYICSVITLPCWMLWYMHIIQQTAF